MREVGDYVLGSPFFDLQSLFLIAGWVVDYGLYLVFSFFLLCEWRSDFPRFANRKCVFILQPCLPVIVRSLDSLTQSNLHAVVPFITLLLALSQISRW